MLLIDSDDSLQVQARGRGLTDLKDTLKPLNQVFNYMLQLRLKILLRRTAPIP